MAGVLPDSMKLYHGTSATNGRHIEAHGLQPAAPNGAVYLSDHAAPFFAWRDAVMRGSNETGLAIVEVDAAPLDHDRLAPDEDYLALIDTARTRGSLAGVSLPEVFNSRDTSAVLRRRGEWPHSLQLSGRVAYLGTVPAAVLRVVFVPMDVLRAHGLILTNDDPVFQREVLDGLLAPGKRDVTSADVFPINYPLVWLAACARFASGGLPVNSYHGPNHWLNVDHIGRLLAALTPGVDADVVRLFAMLHDMARTREGSDPEHSPKAAQWIRAHPELLPHLTADRREKLCYAIAHHTSGTISPDATIGTCWDSDRLDLQRLGIMARPELLSTRAAREFQPARQRSGDCRSHLRSAVFV